MTTPSKPTYCAECGASLTEQEQQALQGIEPRFQLCGVCASWWDEEQYYDAEEKQYYDAEDSDECN